MSAELIALYNSRTELGPLAAIADRASEYARYSKAPNTVRGYQSDWKQFSRWCQGHALSSLPASPDAVALYLTHLAAAHKPATLNRHVAAISQAHQLAGLETPTQNAKVRLVLSGIRRTRGTAQVAKTPVLVDDLRRMTAGLPETMKGTRDRALLLIGFTGAFRRSELVALDVTDADFTREGLVITIRRSKTDQEAQGRKIGIPYGSHPDTCAIRSLQHWLERSGITEGSIFRPINRHSQLSHSRLSGAAVSDIVKEYVGALGLDAGNFAGHSLRAGMATSAAMAGASERSIAKTTGHRSMAVLRRYIRDGSLFRENAAAMLDL